MPFWLPNRRAIKKWPDCMFIITTEHAELTEKILSLFISGASIIKNNLCGLCDLCG